jgi:hypothetical protein
MGRLKMIPLTQSLQIAFNSVIRSRPTPPSKSNEDLSLHEFAYILQFLADNCPAFAVSREEITLLFRSFQRKRVHKKQKNTAKQLSLYA